MTSRRRVAAGLLGATLALSVVPLVAAPAGAVTGPEVVADGLDAPNKLAFGPDGDLYVTEAGTGGDECVELGEGEEAEELCYGETGAVTRIDLDGDEDGEVVGGLPSVVGGEGEVVGPADVAFSPSGDMHLVTGLGGDLADRTALQDDRIASVLKVEGGTITVLSDLLQFEADEDPDQAYDEGLPEGAPPNSEGVDSNPYALTFDGDDVLAVDAGGNDVLRVEPDGTTTLEALLPMGEPVELPPFVGAPPGTKIPYQPVPTSITMDGETPLVGQLTGFPFPVGAAKVWNIAGDTPAPVHEGFTNIVDIDLAPNGDLYVLEFADNGLLSESPQPALVQVRKDGTRKYLAYGDQLPVPSGVEVGPDGMVYVSVLSLAGPGAGQVWRFDPTEASDPAIAAACDPVHVPGTEFPDIKASVHREAIECMTYWGAIAGFGDGTFRPGSKITRAQVASMLARALETAGFPLPDDAPDAFPDDDGVHEPNIDILAELGIVQGLSGGGYGPNQQITRDQLASLFARTWAVVTKAALEPGDDAFTDDEGNVHEDAINAVAAAGWVKGVGDASFAPRADATRGQFATMLARMLSTLVDENGAVPPHEAE